VDVNSDRAMSLLNVAHAAKALADAPLALVPADELEARERELKALDRLMRNAPGAITNARGSRRLVHRPGSLIDLKGAS
jgi:signal transduction histidine kinase